MENKTTKPIPIDERTIKIRGQKHIKNTQLHDLGKLLSLLALGQIHKYAYVVLDDDALDLDTQEKIDDCIDKLEEEEYHLKYYKTRVNVVENVTDLVMSVK